MGQLINGMIVGKVGDKTYYSQDGKQMLRTAKNVTHKRKTSAQFKQMMLFQNRNRLWMVMKKTDELYFEGDKSSTQRQFIAANSQLPAVYLRKGLDATLLLPGMVVSDGPLPSFDYHLGELDGTPALLTTLAEADARKGRLLLYVFRQSEAKVFPSVNAEVIDLSHDTDRVTLTTCDGCLVLTGSIFADEMSGFGLVHVVEGHASRQTLVTRCTVYERYMTEEVLMDAAHSYGSVKNYGVDWTVTLRKK